MSSHSAKSDAYFSTGISGTETRPYFRYSVSGIDDMNKIKHGQSVGVRSCEANSFSAFLCRCSMLHAHPFSHSCQLHMMCSYFQLSGFWTLILFFLLLMTEIMRSNGFCLANTETIVIDHSIPNGKEKHLDVDSAEHL